MSSACFILKMYFSALWDCKFTCHYRCRPLIRLDCNWDRGSTSDYSCVVEHAIETDTDVVSATALQLFTWSSCRNFMKFIRNHFQWVHFKIKTSKYSWSSRRCQKKSMLRSHVWYVNILPRETWGAPFGMKLKLHTANQRTKRIFKHKVGSEQSDRDATARGQLATLSA